MLIESSYIVASVKAGAMDQTTLSSADAASCFEQPRS
jgi:hypothetical protein